MRWYQVFIVAAAVAGAVFLWIVTGALAISHCQHTLRAWDAHQEVLMDCREDPDCYITPADLERVRELAPQVQACEAREAGE